MRREKPIEQWSVGSTSQNMLARSFEGNPRSQSGASEETTGEESEGQLPETMISHERARELVVEQTRRLLPPQDANSLADRCFRYAQDVAHQERQSGKHSAMPREQSRPD